MPSAVLDVGRCAGPTTSDCIVDGAAGVVMSPRMDENELKSAQGSELQAEVIGVESVLSEA